MKSSLPEIAPLLVAWQRRHGRHSLPWQNTRDPYRVWLSEIMLQQTQVATVLGYYQRFLERFPTVRDLAAAELDAVLALWAGLGYYSRARNMHRCAQMVCERFGGEFPRSAALLQELPGIGRSTAAAVASFCFDERVAILDGNVKRVLSRVLAFDGDLAQAAQEKKLWVLATELLPAARDMAPYTQGLMDLGAGLCAAKTPQCAPCPLADLCKGKAQGEPQRFPVKTRKLKRGRRENWWLWLEYEDHIWLQQRPSSGIWAGMWVFPTLDSEAELQRHANGLSARTDELPVIQHALTHLDWTLHTRRGVLARKPDAMPEGLSDGGRWVAREALADYALPAPVKKILG